MSESEPHPSDQDLLLAADGELSRGRAKRVRKHLDACWSCRARMREIENTIADFVHVHQRSAEAQLPSVSSSRALLKAQLAELAAKPRAGMWPRFTQFMLAPRTVAYVCAVLLLAAAGSMALVRQFRGQNQSESASEIDNDALPNRTLTPGATRPVAISDVCSMPHEEVVRAVPTSVRQQVFREYGIQHPRAENYEIDYLIAPGLGGKEDIRNLWPEPYTSTIWNAHVKDALEEHLHQMVCAGKLDLPTAQSDIANNWIAAYKKYFHTREPLVANGHPPFSTSMGNAPHDPLEFARLEDRFGGLDSAMITSDRARLVCRITSARRTRYGFALIKGPRPPTNRAQQG